VVGYVQGTTDGDYPRRIEWWWVIILYVSGMQERKQESKQKAKCETKARNYAATCFMQHAITTNIKSGARFPIGRFTALATSSACEF